MVFATNVYFTLLAIKFFTITYCAIYNPYLNKLDNPFMPREIRPLKDKTNVSFTSNN